MFIIRWQAALVLYMFLDMQKLVYLCDTARENVVNHSHTKN